jgi:hypothetical protein
MSPCDDLSLMRERFGPAPGNARLAQGGQQGWATNSEPRLTNGALGARLSSGSAASKAASNDRL